MEMMTNTNKSVLPKGAGVVTRNLDIVLQEHNIHRQAYHTKSFVGNHCNKYLKVLVIIPIRVD